MSRRVSRMTKKEYLRSVAKRRLCFIVVLFCIYSSMLLFQSHMVYDMNVEIQSLTDEYNTVVKINDDLQGKLLGAKNLSELASYASKTLGMVPSSASHIDYVSYAEQGVNAQGGITTTASSHSSWFDGLFK